MSTWEVVWLVIAINWLSPLLLWLYPLTMLLRKEFVFDGFYGVWAKFRLSESNATPWHVSRWRGWAGVGLYGFICYRPLSHWNIFTTQRIILHEAAHCRQWAVLGLSFCVFYAGHVAWILLTQKLKGPPYTKHPYLDCWCERSARKAAGQRADIPPRDWPGGQEDLWPW